MSRRLRLTLVSALLAALLAGILSAIYLQIQVDKQFQSDLQKSQLLIQLAADAVTRSLENQPTLPVREALIGDLDLADRLLKIMTTSKHLLEIAVCEPSGKVLVSTDGTRKRDEAFPGYGDFAVLAGQAGILDRIYVLFGGVRQNYYQLTESLVAEDEGPIVSIRVVVFPALIRDAIGPDLQSALLLSVATVAGSSLAALLFFGIAFRPLSQVSRMLDLITRGEYAAQKQEQPGQDEFGAVLSKVNLLGQQMDNFDRLLDQLEEAVLVFGRDRGLVVASGALDIFLGRRRAELTGATMTSIFPSESPIGVLLDQIAEANKPVRNIRVALPEGAKLSHGLLSVEILETQAGGGARSAGMLVRLRDPEARRQIQGQLQTAERLSAINRVTSGVAHEVKNPLNAILMHVELAKMKLAKGDSGIAPQMEIIGQEILRLDRVVKTFLDFARPAELRLAEVGVDKVVSDLVDLARPQAATAGIQVEAEMRAAGATIAADVDLLRQAVLNIVVNAIESMGAGGTLRFQSRVAGEEAEVRIADTGCGIAPEVREKIFQLYFTTKPAGSGIGLAMAFRMMQLHGGKIEFSSEPGKGTEFVLRFPLAGSPQ